MPAPHVYMRDVLTCLKPMCTCVVWPPPPHTDFKNGSIVAHYIKERTKNAQFVIISLRNNMFELADRLVGIYKTDNATKTVTINPAEFGAAPGQQQQEAGAEVAGAQPIRAH